MATQTNGNTKWNQGLCETPRPAGQRIELARELSHENEEGLLAATCRFLSSARQNVRRHFAFVWRVFHWQADFKRLSPRRQPIRRRANQFGRNLRIEPLEQRLALTGTTVILQQGVNMVNGVDVLTSAQLPTSASNLIDQATNSPVNWQNNDTLIIPSSFAGLPIAIEDSASGLTPIAADKIEVQAPGVTLAGETTADELYIDPANPTTLAADSGDDVTISAEVTTLPGSSGSTVLNTTGNSGTVVLASNASIGTLTVVAGAVEVASGSTITATTLAVNGGNATIDAGAQIAATSATVSFHTLDVEGQLTLSQGLTVSGTGLLAGSNGDANIAIASTYRLLYTSSGDSAYQGTITGDGELDLDSSTAATLTLGKTGYASTFTGGVDLQKGTLKLASANAIPGQTSLQMSDGAILDLNGYEADLKYLNGGPGNLITNGASTTAELSIVGMSGVAPSSFAGTIEDGVGRVNLLVVTTAVYLTGTAGFSGGTMLEGANLSFQGGYTTALLGSEFDGNLDSTLTFYVPATDTQTFTGLLSNHGAVSGQGFFAVTKDGPGTLILNPAVDQCYYTYAEVDGGQLTFASALATPPATGNAAAGLYVMNGATADLGGSLGSPLPFGNVVLEDGTITDGTLTAVGNGATAATITVEYGLFSANIAGAGALNKEDYNGTGSLVTVGSIPAGTVVLAGNATSVGPTSVDGGTLQVNAALAFDDRSRQRHPDHRHEHHAGVGHHDWRSAPPQRRTDRRGKLSIHARWQPGRRRLAGQHSRRSDRRQRRHADRQLLRSLCEIHPRPGERARAERRGHCRQRGRH